MDTDMNPGWRKSSHSSHAGDNCVEISLRVLRHAKAEPADPRRGHMTRRRGSGWWYVSARI